MNSFHDQKNDQIKYQAVIFDLFGTLVPNFSEREYHQVVMQMAAILSVPADQFWQSWKAAFRQRALGMLPDLNSQIAEVCQQLGQNVEKDNIREAARLRFNYEKRAIVPRPNAIETLSALKSKGIRIGLISDCSSEVPAIWNNTPFGPFFDVAIFSCEVRLKKPDPRIFQSASKRIKVDPNRCIYVGDGSSQELPGALRVGMLAVQLRVPGEDDPDVYRIDDEEWKGRRIESLIEVLDLLN